MSVRNETHTNILILNKQYNKNLDTQKNLKTTNLLHITELIVIILHRK